MKTNNKPIVKYYQIIGDIRDFPREIIIKMIENQILQGNKPDILVFQKDRNCQKDSGGFDWEKTVDGIWFWRSVLCERNYNLFFRRHPNEI